MYTISISFHQKLMRIYRWHHLLKGTMLEGKRNRRMDNLIYVILHKVIPHFRAKHRRQQLASKGLTWRSNTEMRQKQMRVPLPLTTSKSLLVASLILYTRNLTQAENTLWISTTTHASAMHTPPSHTASTYVPSSYYSLNPWSPILLPPSTHC